MASGSNAPVIYDALVAWPPPPSIARFATSPPGTARKQRFSIIGSPPGANHLTTTFVPNAPIGGYASPRSDGGNTARSSRAFRSPSVKGKERAPPTSLDDGRAPRRDYAPPKRPLSPAQLGRIAQSFGIVVPGMREAGTGGSYTKDGSPSVRSPSRSAPQPNPCGQVVAVVPPASLLGASTGLDPEAARERERRWRRGRLLPLQPTLGAMLVAIAREFGLPSTTGVSVYLGPQSGAYGGSHDSGSACSDDGEAGPLVTPATWSTLFTHASRSASMSPSPTPGMTPQKFTRHVSTATFGGGSGPHSMIVSSPLAPVSEVEPPEPDHFRSLSSDKETPMPNGLSRSSNGSSASSFSPRTPASLGSNISQVPVFGTIEFDVDPSEARWLDDWMLKGGATRRKGTEMASAEGMRELQLVERLKDERPKFLRDMEAEVERAEAKAAAAKAAAVAAAKERELANARANDKPPRRPLGDAFPAANKLAERKVERLPAASAVKERKIGIDRNPNGGSMEDLLPEGFNQDIAEVVAMLDAGDANEALLASPITLGRERFAQAPNSIGLGYPSVAAQDDMRASGIVMADQLDKLETMMRDLSPRDIAFSSPRSASSPLSAESERAPVKLHDLPARGSSRLPYLQPDPPRRMSPLGPGKRAASDPHRTPGSELSSPPTQWPAVPYDRLREVPPVSQSRRLGSDGTSERNHRRQESASSNGQAPRRPARPPTPDLATPELVQQVLPPEKVDAVVKAGATPSPGDPRNRTTRPSSISLRGLRRQVSSKVLAPPKDQVRPRDRAHAYAVANSRGVESSPDGSDFHPPSAFAYNTTGHAPSRSNLDPEQDIPPPLPVHGRAAASPYVDPYGPPPPGPGQHSQRGGGPGFTSRFFNFGGRKRDEPQQIMSISSPIASSVKHVTPADLAASGAAGGLSAGPLPGPAPSTPLPAARYSDQLTPGDDRRASLPNSPTSPRHVRRKPVPGMAGQRDSTQTTGSVSTESPARYPDQ